MLISGESLNSFDSIGDTHGKGNLRYCGLGVLGRLDFTPTLFGHFYSELSFRAGGTTNGYFNGDIRDNFGRGDGARYDTSY